LTEHMNIYEVKKF